MTEQNRKPYVRLSVSGGGCSGFQYDWDFVDSNQGGTLIEDLLILDSMAEMFVIGCTVDYITELGGSYLKVINPNAKASCGCGESFAVWEQNMYEYKCNLVKVVDGDTIDVDIDLGFGVWMQNQRIRMYAIDTPESRTSDDVEKVYGNAAKDFLVKWTNSGDLTLKTFKDGKGKYGRILGEIWYAGEHNINQLLVDNHHAVRYHGQSKDDIAEEHLANREKLNLT